MGGPRVETVERTTGATPLAEQFLQLLQGELDTGALGTGVGPLQREAGTAIQQYVQALQQRAQEGPGASNLISAIEEGSAERTRRGAADLREGFGIAGARFGTPSALGEARFRSDVERDLAETTGRIGLEEDLAIQQLLQGGIAQMFGQGQAALDPFIQLAQLGILPPEVIASPGIGEQLLSGGLSGLGAFFGTGGARSIADLFSGDQPTIPQAPAPIQTPAAPAPVVLR